MSEVNSIGGGGGLQGYITDPPAEPEPGDRFLGAPAAPLAPGDRYLSDAPAPPAAGDRRLSDPPAPPEPGDPRLGDQRPASGNDRQDLVKDATTGQLRERYITDPPSPGDGFITDPPKAPGPGDAFLATGRGEAPAPRKTPTAGDHALSSLNNVGRFFEDVWDKNYGEAALDAGNAVMDAGSALGDLIFGTEKKAPPTAK